MNIRVVLKTVSLFFLFLGGMMVFPLVCAFIYHEKVWFSFFESMVLTMGTGGFVFLLLRRTEERIFSREGFAIVAFCWILGSFFGSMPFIFAQVMSPIDAFFETVSGFTTTGATILSDIEILPKSILFWRSFTQWLGGMGIVVLFVAVFPYLGVAGRQLFRSESSASSWETIRPKIRETAQRLWYVYLGLTIFEIVLLHLGGVDWFNSICHTFTTLATGGFSNYNASVAAFDSLFVEVVILVFMLLAGINFFVLYNLISGQIKKSYGLSEVKGYLVILLVATVLTTLSLFNMPGSLSLGECMRKGAFQVVSIMTTTGFVTDNYELWPSFSKILLVCLMFIGSCAGSTGGGIKVIRFQIAFKFLFNQISKSIHLGAVKTVKISGSPVSEDDLTNVLGFFLLSIASVVLLTLLMAMTGLDIVTAFSSVCACLWNIGPGLGGVGAIENYGFISFWGKIVLSLSMILGRLEFFALLVLFFPSFWKK